MKIPFLLSRTARTSQEYSTTDTTWYWRWHLVLLIPQVRGPSTMRLLFVGAVVISHPTLWKKPSYATVNVYDCLWVSIAHSLWSAILLPIKEIPTPLTLQRKQNTKEITETEVQETAWHWHLVCTCSYLVYINKKTVMWHKLHHASHMHDLRATCGRLTDLFYNTKCGPAQQRKNF